MKILISTTLPLDDFPEQFYFDNGVTAIRYLGPDEPNDYTADGVFNVELTTTAEHVNHVLDLIQIDANVWMFARVDQRYYGDD